MKFHSMRSALTVFATLFAAALVASCGGGGAAGNPNQGGPISLSPQTGTFYAGVPARFTLQGGRKPYSLTSSEPGVLPVPALVDANVVDVIPNNPGVVDTGLKPEDLPVRSVTVSMRDSTGILVSSQIKVAVNFLTGYGLTLTPNTCPVATGTTSTTVACAGGRTAARLLATFNGSASGNREFRFQVLSGNFSLTDPATGQSSSSILLRSDHTGEVLAFIDVPANAAGGLGVIRVIDVATGVYADQVFVITPVVIPARTITVIPSDISLVGASATRCGIGSSDVLAFGGIAPYTAISTDPSVLVTPSTSSTQPGRFTIQVIKENPPCLTSATVVITDASGGRATVTIKSAVGVAGPPLTVSPTTITLACGASGSVSVIGGTGGYFVNSTNSNVTAVVSGNTLSINRSNAGGINGLPGGSAVISVTDGATIGSVTVTAPPTCP